jgi:death-on-curing protein
VREPVWLTLQLILAIHDEQLAEFGGAPGLRDVGALESALVRPIDQFLYGATDLVALAAAYGFGLSRNHAFVDGNKRMALLAIVTFLGLNGVDFSVPEPEAVAMMLALAAGEIDEDGLARWIADNIPQA